MPSSFYCADGSVSSSFSHWCLNFHTLFNAAYSSLISVSILRNRFICSSNLSSNLFSLLVLPTSYTKNWWRNNILLSRFWLHGSVRKNMYFCSEKPPILLVYQQRDFLGTWDQPHIWCSSFKLSNTSELLREKCYKYERKRNKWKKIWGYKQRFWSFNPFTSHLNILSTLNTGFFWVQCVIDLNNYPIKS